MSGCRCECGCCRDREKNLRTHHVPAVALTDVSDILSRWLPEDVRRELLWTLSAAREQIGKQAETEAQLAEARAVLREVEFSDGSAGFLCCPVCAGLEPPSEGAPTDCTRGHAPDCRLAKCIGGGT